jgi:hypothetical protein
MNKETILHHYLIAALWTAELDNSNIENIQQYSIDQAKKDIDLFVNKCEKDLIASGLSDEQIGHDFWLTRNHHGAGFWDRGLEQGIADRLTATCHDFKEMNVFSDDGSVVDIE